LNVLGVHPESEDLPRANPTHLDKFARASRGGGIGFITPAHWIPLKDGELKAITLRQKGLRIRCSVPAARECSGAGIVGKSKISPSESSRLATVSVEAINRLACRICLVIVSSMAAGSIELT
jgi:hypothetical protein